MLSEAQRRSLRQLAAADETPPSVGRRARWVLEADVRVGQPDRTAAKWLHRFAEHGVAGLEDAPRTGRPTTLSEEDARRVLAEPLFIPSAKWTSRAVSQAVGISQASVVRLWARTFAPETLAHAGPWPSLDRSCRPMGLLYGPRGALLVLERLETRRPSRLAPEPASESSWMRSPLRTPLQTILAGDLVDLDTRGSVSSSAFLRAAMSDPDARYVVISSLPAGDLDAQTLERPAQVLTIDVPDGQWQALLPHLVGAMTPSSRQAVEKLSHRVREWAAEKPGSGLHWTAAAPGPTVARPDRTPAVPVSQLLSPSQRLAEQVAMATLAGIHHGQLRGGERLTESFLMRATHASRSQVRDALRTLATDGLIDLRPGSGATVPVPRSHDVLETYALRRAVGGIAVTAAADWRPGRLGPLLDARETLLEVARSGDVRATGFADLDLQDALATVSGLRRVLMMFRRLTIQVKLFTSVMGLNYAYSIEDIVADDTAIVEAVGQRDPREARRLWEQKMEAAKQYMVRQLEHKDWP